MNSFVWDDCGHSFLFKNNYRKMCVFCSFFLKYGKMHFCITSQLTSWKSYKVIIYRLHLCSRGTDRRKFKSQNVFFRFSFELDSEDCKKKPKQKQKQKKPPPTSWYIWATLLWNVHRCDDQQRCRGMALHHKKTPKQI